MPIGGDQIPTRGLTGGEGKVRGKVQERTAVTGVAGVGKRGTVAAYRRRTGAGGGAPRNGGGVPMAGGQESGGEVARQLPRDDVVLMVCLAGVERRRSGGTMARPSGGGRAHRRSGPVDLAWETKIGWACEHQWVAAMLLEYWIEGGRRQRRLSTVSRGSGGALARCGARGREKRWKCKCVMARVSCGEL
jgi:hypothetical protein